MEFPFKNISILTGISKIPQTLIINIPFSLYHAEKKRKITETAANCFGENQISV